jgi:hypothetical protein
LSAFAEEEEVLLLPNFEIFVAGDLKKADDGYYVLDLVECQHKQKYVF